MTVVPVQATADVRSGGTTYYIDNQAIGSASSVPLANLLDYGRGSLIIGGAAVWEDLVIGAAGSALTSDGTDISWDNTPTWTGLHQFDAGIDLNGFADALILDGDGDTTISAPTANQIDIEIAGADDFTFTANSFNVLAGSSIEMADDTSIGQAAGPTVTFDDTANELIITGTATLQIVTGVTTEPIILIENTNINTVAGGLDFYKNTASRADDDDIGTIRFYGNNTGDAKTLYASIASETLDVTGGSGAGNIRIEMLMDSVFRNMLDIKGYNGALDQGEIIVNDDEQDVDFTIKASGAVNALFVRGSDGFAGFGIAAPDGTVHIHTASAGAVSSVAGADDLTVENSTTGGITILTDDAGTSQLILGSPSDSTGARINWNFNSLLMRIGTATANGEVSIQRGAGVEAIRIDSVSNVGINVIPTSKLHVDQSSGSGAIPVLTLDQGDADQEMMELLCTVGVGNAIEAVGGKALTTTHYVKVTIQGGLTRYFPVGTIAAPV